MAIEITMTNYEQLVGETGEGILLFTKKLCPHCKNMGKVMEKFASKRPAVRLLTADSEEQPDLMTVFGAERVPTIVVIKNGLAVGQKSGLMNPRELEMFFSQA